MGMKRSTILVAVATASLALAAGALAAQTTPSLTGVAGGLWELSGVPGSKSAVKQCVADPVELAFAEHHGAVCTHQVLDDSGDILRIGYQCGAGGYGQATIKTITPRSLRVDVQGIAAGGPYAYVMQAHRAGDCPVKAERGGH